MMHVIIEIKDSELSSDWLRVNDAILNIASSSSDEIIAVAVMNAYPDASYVRITREYPLKW